jgi:uncharacterized protein
VNNWKLIPFSVDPFESVKSVLSVSVIEALKVMTIPRDLLDILVCPVCKTSLALNPQQTSLKCSQCHRAYPIRDDIPILLEDQATIENG